VVRKILIAALVFEALTMFAPLEEVPALGATTPEDEKTMLDITWSFKAGPECDCWFCNAFRNFFTWWWPWSNDGIDWDTYLGPGRVYG
jgi:hypothetical protein